MVNVRNHLGLTDKLGLEFLNEVPVARRRDCHSARNDKKWWLTATIVKSLSTKRGVFVDKQVKNALLSTKQASFVDKLLFFKAPSTNRALFVDEHAPRKNRQTKEISEI